MTTYGDIDVSSTVQVKQLSRLFYLKVYDNFVCNMDEARAHAFSMIKGDLGCFPPTEYSFHYHMLCALFRILIYKASQQNNPNIHAPTQFLRKNCDKPSRPLASNGKHYCKCVKRNCTKRFSCIAADVNCVVACKCSVKPD